MSEETEPDVIVIANDTEAAERAVGHSTRRVSVIAAGAMAMLAMTAMPMERTFTLRMPRHYRNKYAGKNSVAAIDPPNYKPSIRGAARNEKCDCGCGKKRKRCPNLA